MIGQEVWDQGSKDIRDVISLVMLVQNDDGYEQIEGLVKNFDKITTNC
jgi:hypothetical protein